MQTAPAISSEKARLDDVLVARGYFASRSRARDAVLRGTVTGEGLAVTKPGKTVPGTVAIEVDDPAQSYVSRAALKLIKGLDTFSFDRAGSTALDLGASTGGFTQVLLERGADHVVAIDVGHGQMRPEISADPRVTNLEGINARDLDVSHLGGRVVDFIVCDVSFISLKLALQPALAHAAPGSKGVFLIKPQFEVGKAEVGKGGLVSPDAGAMIADELSNWLDAQPGWSTLGHVPSPIEGGDGNREFLLGGIKDQ